MKRTNKRISKVMDMIVNEREKQGHTHIYIHICKSIKTKYGVYKHVGKIPT